MSSSSAVALIPKPRGGVPRGHEWDGVRGAYVHKETGAVHVKGTRSAASAAQQKERKDERDRSDRPQASGSQKRNQAQAEARKADANRRRQVVSQHRKAVREKARPRLGESFASIRQREEQRLLGKRFLFEPQRVRVCEGALAGQCGTVLDRAQLCFQETARRVTSLELDASGRVAITEPRHHHQILLDGSEDEEPVLLSPYAVEPWPGVGQLVDMHHGSNLENEPDRAMNHLGTVVAFHPWQHWGLEGESFYLVKRQTFALPEHVEAMAGGDVCIGSWVRLLPPHPDAHHTLQDRPPGSSMVRGKHEPGEFAARRMLDRLQLQEPAELTTTHAHKLLEVLPNTLAEEAYLPLLDVHVVRDRCAACRDCLVLETTFLLAYDTDFEPLDSNDMQNPCRSHCPSDHAFMCECARQCCSHWECKYRCRDCMGSDSDCDSESGEENA